ncbi:T9SS type A sorting domain-containing protein [bacterium]|nr:T9SS type A sorting domain-containing protein [bacterium]
MQSSIPARGPVRLTSALVPAMLMGWCISNLAFAQWTSDRNTNMPVCTASGDQTYPSIISDNAGGAIIVWQDSRNGKLDIYAQRLDAKGTALWGKNGVAVCLAPNDQHSIKTAGDGSGGVIIAWTDLRNSTFHLYAQRVDANGQPLWIADGVPVLPLSTMLSSDSYKIVGDGTGGAIIAWDCWTSTDQKVFVQRLNAGGAWQWPANGVAVFSAPNPHWVAALLALHEGGVIIAWTAWQAGDRDLYAQRLDANGNPQWTADGVGICVEPRTRDLVSCHLISDGANGAIITWQDNRKIYFRIYAQHLDASGAAQWDSNGVAIQSPYYLVSGYDLDSDGAGGGIVTMVEYQNLLNAQRFNATGQSLWGSEGVRVSTSTYAQRQPTMVSDGAGGAIITWREERDARDYIFAQRLGAYGQRLWTDTGVTLTTATGTQENQQIIGDQAGGAIVAWHDTRNGDADLYAQRIGRRGELVPKPTILSVQDVPHDQGGKVIVRWQAADLDTIGGRAIEYYSIWRSVRPSPYAPIDWEWVGNQPRHNFPTYACTIPTLYDSMATTAGNHSFLVSAHTGNPNIFWDSNLMSGYSVDNLPPAAPGNVTAAFVAGEVVLRWRANQESDFAGYEIYWSNTPNFDPDTMTALATTADTSFVHYGVPANRNQYYALRAVDVHGNRSAKSNEAAVMLVGVEETPAIAAAFSLEQNYPNPFNPTTTITFTLLRSAFVTVKILTIQGEEVATLVSEKLPAGKHQRVWEAKGLASGVYLYRLEAGEFAQTRKLILLR